MKQNDLFYCYSLKMFHFISAFGEKCYGSHVNSVSKNRYWTFKKSKRLDEIIEFYNQSKHKFN